MRFVQRAERTANLMQTPLLYRKSLDGCVPIKTMQPAKKTFSQVGDMKGTQLSRVFSQEVGGASSQHVGTFWSKDLILA